MIKAPCLVEDLGAMQPGPADRRGRCRFRPRPRIRGRFEKNTTRSRGHGVVDVLGTLGHEPKEPRLVHRSSVHPFLCLNFPFQNYVHLKSFQMCSSFLKHGFCIGPQAGPFLHSTRDSARHRHEAGAARDGFDRISMDFYGFQWQIMCIHIYIYTNTYIHMYLS